MAQYQIKKETRLNGDKYLWAYFDNEAITSSCHFIDPKNENSEKEGIEKLKGIIETHKLHMKDSTLKEETIFETD